MILYYKFKLAELFFNSWKSPKTLFRQNKPLTVTNNSDRVHIVVKVFSVKHKHYGSIIYDVGETIALTQHGPQDSKV